MILGDSNLLLYAYDSRSKLHDKAKSWLEEAFSRPEPLCFAWLTLTAFIRIATHPRVFERPLSLAETVSIVSEWMKQSNFVILHPGERHWDIYRACMNEARAMGPLVMDSHLAALAIEHGATLHTNDKDFSRFKDLKLPFPLEPGD